MAKNPIEEFLLEKKAFNLSGAAQKAGPVAKRMGEAAGTALLTGAGAAAFAGLTGAAGKLYLAATKTRDFKSMLEANPDLHEHLEANPAGFNRLFTSLRTFAPEFTQDPLVSGQFMRNGMYSGPEGMGDVPVKALNARKPQRSGPVSDAALGGFMKGLSVPGGERPQLHKQTKSTFNPPAEGQNDPQLRGIEEIQNYYR